MYGLIDADALIKEIKEMDAITNYDTWSAKGKHEAYAEVIAAIKRMAAVKEETMKFTEVRRLDADGLGNLCITQVYYNQGTNKEYNQLLRKADDCENFTTDVIAELAEDIIEHTSDLYPEDMTSVMFNIARQCMTFFRECKEEGHEDDAG